MVVVVVDFASLLEAVLLGVVVGRAIIPAIILFVSRSFNLLAISFPNTGSHDFLSERTFGSIFSTVFFFLQPSFLIVMMMSVMLVVMFRLVQRQWTTFFEKIIQHFLSLD